VLLRASRLTNSHDILPGLSPAFIIWAIMNLLMVTELGAQTTGNDWQVGSIVELSKGTQIRQGPGFGYCFHTIVPEDNWAVRIISGPRTSDGRAWYDTSRKAAGDPVGGTGWVNVDQADSHPAVTEPGTWCPGFGPSASVGPGSNSRTSEPSRWPPQFLLVIINLWLNLSLPVKALVLVVGLVLLPASTKLRMFGSLALVSFARAILWGIVLGGIADLTRPLWEPSWLALPTSYRILDPALVLLFLPLGWWAFGFIAAVAGIAIALGVLILLLLLVLMYFAYILDVIRML
jgi:hypothetical protein